MTSHIMSKLTADIA